MITVTEFESDLAARIPQTYELLRTASLVVHPAVTRITLHGSRGLIGGYRSDSDIDLGLVVETSRRTQGAGLDDFLRQLLETTLSNWRSNIEPDIAAVFDKVNCGLKCLDSEVFDEQLCRRVGRDCLGVYKIQKGFNGFVSGPAAQVTLMFPCVTIWKNKSYPDVE